MEKGRAAGRVGSTFCRVGSGPRKVTRGHSGRITHSMYQSTSPHRSTSNPGFVRHHCSPHQPRTRIYSQIRLTLRYINTCVEHSQFTREI